MDRAVEEGSVRYVTDAALEAVTGRLAPCSCSWSSAVRRQHVATKAAESAVWGGSAWTGLQPAGVAKARQTWLGKPWSLGFGQADPWGPEGAGLESAEGSLSQLEPDGEQRLPQRGGRREREEQARQHRVPRDIRPSQRTYGHANGHTATPTKIRPRQRSRSPSLA